MDFDKRLQILQGRLAYVDEVFGSRKNAHCELLFSRFNDVLHNKRTLVGETGERIVSELEELFDVLEKNLDEELIPMDRVRIVRHAQRISLKDILENVYDNYIEIGGKDDLNVDPSILIARAYISRRIGKRVVNQMVMVIGHETGHGEEFRNGGSASPWGNARALEYMRVAETENIPIHTFVFTPGAYPIEENPGAARQIAKNLYEMAGLSVPLISVISEGGSGGAEALALADRRLMLSRGYYSVISPEGAAAIESGLRSEGDANPAVVERCAAQLQITAEDNLKQGYIDHIVPEPPLGARPYHYDFFRTLRRQLVASTNEVVAYAGGLRLFRALVLRNARSKGLEGAESIFVRWSLAKRGQARLLRQRRKRFRKMAQHAYLDDRTLAKRFSAAVLDAIWSTHSYIRYDLLGKHRRALAGVMEDIGAEAEVVRSRVWRPALRYLRRMETSALPFVEVEQLTRLSCPEDGACKPAEAWSYVSPKSESDKTVTCPKASSCGCHDLWAPDLFGEFAGVCRYCGHHFPMEYPWYLYNILNYDKGFEFNSNLQAINPLGYESFDLKLQEARKKTGLKSSCITFETELHGIDAVVVVLTAPFRGGSVGAAEGEKFIRAAERARKKHYPLITFVHGTAGMRIQEGTNAVIQMPRCTIAARQYVEAGGLYLVVYDTNSYAGPVASFLGCSPYQFAIMSSRIGFAGPAVIRETTGLEMPPDYHSAENALSRGFIQGIWDRRELSRNLHQALLTMGGRNLYYR
ncbi:MAG: carboxyl transferase domain-containing protein [Desulfovibrio sp.]